MEFFCAIAVIGVIIAAVFYIKHSAQTADPGELLDELDEQVQQALRSTFTEEVVGPKDYRAGLRGVFAQQHALVQALKPGERLNLVIPAMRQGRFEGLAVVADQRVIEFKNEIKSQVPIHEIVTTKLGTHPGGFAIAEIIGENYTPFSSGISSWQLELNRKNHVQVDFPMLSVARHFVAIIDGQRGRND
ncbi:hypothetical protein ACQPYA_18665 [Micromonospora sp. CA-263727]|uniref:hypothetical protein n=1 Tax=Micromonospora sp. CA-263727 TaxID=3239967 RepID=UPI003D920977